MRFGANRRDLRRRLDAIDGAIAEQQEPEVELGPTVTITIPSNGFEAAFDAELRTLQELVCSEYDLLTPCSDGAFERAFVAIGTMNRLSAPDRNISFHTHVDNVAEVAGQLGFIGAIPGNAVLLAVIAHGDVAWIAYDLAAVRCSRWRSPIDIATVAPVPMRGAGFWLGSRLFAASPASGSRPCAPRHAGVFSHLSFAGADVPLRSAESRRRHRRGCGLIFLPARNLAFFMRVSDEGL